jgi:hypothetical protein
MRARLAWTSLDLGRNMETTIQKLERKSSADQFSEKPHRPTLQSV